MIGRLYPFGYAERTAPARLEQLMADEQTWLIDIRRVPWCRWNAAWCAKGLEQRWGRRYHQFGAWFGNLNYRGGPIQLADPRNGIWRLENILKHRSAVILCACLSYDTCHRKTVCELMQERLPELEIVR